MCYAAGSIDAVNPCPMCKVFPHARCPHVRETCRNRALHPRMDVLYIRNAEVERFNGCGYCKWASTSPPPPPDTLRYSNPGWPGCCRAPSDSERESISAAEWRAVSIVHNVPIPSEIKAVLDALQARGPPMSPFTPSSRASTRPANGRKNSGSCSPSTKPSTLSKTVGSPTSVKPRSGSSPQTPSTTLSKSSGSAVISSPVQTSPVADPLAERRQRVEGVHSSHPSPSRKNIDLSNPSTPPSRRSSMRRPTVTAATTSVSVSKVIANCPPPTQSGAQNQGSARRRSSVSKPEKHEPAPERPANSVTSPTRYTPQRPSALVIPMAVPRSGDDNLSSASSSSGSSDGLGSISDSTITSDGGFTDYLSDESEAELQRQAEAKAAVLAMNMAEELEFKAARLQLAHVDLRPPKSWNPTTRMVGPPIATGSISSIGQARG